jgi:hypothetical protein
MHTAIKLRVCAGEVSRLAPQTLSRCPREMSRVAQKNGDRVLENCPGWQPKFASVCRRIFEGGTKKWRQCPGECRGLHPKNNVGVLLECPECQPKNCVNVDENCRVRRPKIRQGPRVCRGRHTKWGTVSSGSAQGGIQKAPSVCSRNIHGCSQKCGQCPGEMSRIAPKKMASFSSRIIEGGSQKVVSVSGEVSRVTHKCAPVSSRIIEGGRKNGVRVHANCRGWHPKRDSVSSRSVHGGSQKWRQCAGELVRGASKKRVSVQVKRPGWKTKKA